MADLKPSNIPQEEDDEPKLSPYALDALREFLAEQTPSIAEHRRETDEGEEQGERVHLLPEDWRMSQFWYSPETARIVAEEVFYLLTTPLDANGDGDGDGDESPPPSVACIACPTLFLYLKKMYPNVSAQLLEYDKRFAQYGSDFTFYDYNVPEELPHAMKHAYQIIVVDPPYLSEECLEKVAQTIAFLAHPGKVFLLLLTGEVQRERAAKLLDVHPCGFRPEHANKLGNEFRLYTSYNPGNRIGAWQLEE